MSLGYAKASFSGYSTAKRLSMVIWHLFSSWRPATLLNMVRVAELIPPSEP